MIHPTAILRNCLTLLQDARRATAIEYGLIPALISVAYIIAFETLGLNLVDVFTTIANALRR